MRTPVHDPTDHQERDDERRRDHPRGAAHAVDDRQRAAAAARVAFHVGEVLGRRRAEQEQPEDGADDTTARAPTIVLTADQPATFSSTPRGIAMVMLAQMPSRLVRSGGTE